MSNSDGDGQKSDAKRRRGTDPLQTTFDDRPDPTTLAQFERDDPPAERPAECGCWESTTGMPCAPCMIAGFARPNPDQPGADGGAADE